MGKILIGLLMAVGLLAMSAFGPNVSTESKTSTTKSEKNQGKVYDKVEQMPEFPGGQTELVNFLVNTIQYPKESLKKGTQGKVFVGFVVGIDGSILKARIERGVDPLLDAEALRVVNSMPKWIPGKEKGKDVAVQFTLPINFRLQ